MSSFFSDRIEAAGGVADVRNSSVRRLGAGISRLRRERPALPVNASTVRSERLRMRLPEVTKALIGTRARAWFGSVSRRRSARAGTRSDRRSPSPRRSRPAVVTRRLTSPPISSRSRRTRTSGTSANGIPNDRNTWLRTSARDGLAPDREQGQRREHRHRPPDEDRDPAPDEPPASRPARPSCPTEDDEMPRREQSDAEDRARVRVQVRPRAGRRPRSGRRRRPAIRSCGRRRPTSLSIAMLIAPAMPIAITTSISSKRKIRRRALLVDARRSRRCVSAECR